MNRLQQEHDKKVSDLRAEHHEVLRHTQLEAEDELREKTMSLEKDYEGQMRTLRSQHEVHCQKRQEELELQKSKEERQRALLLWKVMDENPQEDPEVSSKKVHSVSSIKKDSDGENRNQRRPENDGMISKKPGNTATSAKYYETSGSWRWHSEA